MTTPAPITAWAVTTGEDGMRTQVRGLARAVADVVVEKTLARGLVAGSFGSGDAFGPPWPDLLITCGRRSTALSKRIRAASAGACVTVQVQDPRTSRAAFDLVVAMGHDRLPAGGNVVKIATALHDLTPELLDEAAATWRPVFAPLGSPLVGVVVGGDLRGRRFTRDDARRLIGGLQRLRAAGMGLAITPSRRTPAAVRAMLAAAFAGDPRVFLWNMQGDNPYRGILSLADRLVVTSDSVSMVSEALAARAPVEVLDLGFRRHVGFIADLAASGAIRRFEGDPSPPPSRPPINETARVAEIVNQLLSERASSERPAVPAPASRR